MRAARRAVPIALVVIGVTGTSLSAQSTTGPGKEQKPASVSAETVLALDEADWATLSDDELVVRLVYDPVKVIGLRRFRGEGLIALKGLVAETETSVRNVLERLRHGDTEAVEASRSLEPVLRHFSTALSELEATR